jgi:hypothetical protein
MRLIALAAITLMLADPIEAAQHTKTRPAGETALTNADVLALLKASMPESIVLTKIRTAPVEKLDTSSQALVSLKEAGASATVLEAILKRSGNPPEAVAAAVPPQPTAAAPAPTSVAVVVAPPAPEVPLERQGEANYKTKGGYWSGEGKWTEATLPGPRPLPALIDRILPIVAEGGWEIANVSKDGGTISANQPISTLNGSAKVNLNVIASRTDDGGARVQLIIKAPAGSKVTDKEVKTIFTRILKALS